MPHSEAHIHRRELTIDGLRTSFLEAGRGSPVVLLHGGEFGASAELAWERVIAPLAEHHRVIAPDFLGFGHSAKVIDFVEGRSRPIHHVASLLRALGVESAGFVGNSFGGVNLLFDQSSATPALPVSSMVIICGGGEILQNEHSAALYDYDATIESMRKIVGALFHDPGYAEDEDYVLRRYESSILPGAWEAVAAARFRRPGHQSSSGATPAYERVSVPTLVIEGENDKLKPPGWAQGIAESIPGATSTVVAASGHCPQIEQPETTALLLLDFFANDATRTRA